MSPDSLKRWTEELGSLHGWKSWIILHQSESVISCKSKWLTEWGSITFFCFIIIFWSGSHSKLRNVCVQTQDAFLFILSPFKRSFSDHFSKVGSLLWVFMAVKCFGQSCLYCSLHCNCIVGDGVIYSTSPPSFMWSVFWVWWDSLNQSWCLGFLKCQQFPKWHISRLRLPPKKITDLSFEVFDLVVTTNTPKC